MSPRELQSVDSPVNGVEVETLWAEKLWGRGKLIRRLHRLRCAIFGHDFTPWREDDPDFGDEEELPWPPPPDVALTWLRGCTRDCGCVQSAQASMLQRGGLPK